MRASRLLSILMLLQTRGRMTAPALAAELEVSWRTVLRDIDELSAAGVPVWSDRGRDGGFRLREGWSTQLTGLTEDEAQALFLAGLPTAATELGLGGASASARLKMLSALPASLREDASRVGARLHIDAFDWYRAATPPPHLQAVAEAVWHQRVLAIRYDAWSGEKDRVIKPLGLVLKAGIWYVVGLNAVARDTTRGVRRIEPLTYRLSNIRELSVREGTFKYPGKFRLAEYWQAATRRFEAEIYTGEAVIRATPRGIKHVSEISAAISDAVTRSLRADPGGKGWQRATIPIESIERAAHQMLGMGADVEVLEPVELRERVREQLKALGALYRGK